MEKINWNATDVNEITPMECLEKMTQGIGFGWEYKYMVDTLKNGDNVLGYAQYLRTANSLRAKFFGFTLKHYVNQNWDWFWRMWEFYKKCEY